MREVVIAVALLNESGRHQARRKGSTGASASDPPQDEPSLSQHETDAALGSRFTPFAVHISLLLPAIPIASSAHPPRPLSAPPTTHYIPHAIPAAVPTHATTPPP